MVRSDEPAETETQNDDGAALPVAVKKAGSGPPLLLFHGGMGSWTHWLRNIDALASHFTVMALDLPGYGDAPAIDRTIEPEAYLDVVEGAVRRLCVDAPKVAMAGFSFGSAVAAAMAARLGARVERLSLIGAAGFDPGGRPALPMRSYKETRGDENAFLDVLRHNLLVLMLKHPESVDDATLALQRANVERTRFNSRKISLQPRLVDDLERAEAKVQLIWGQHDPTAYPSIEARAELCRRAVPDLRLDVVPDAGHWAQYERPEVVNRLMIEFLTGDNAHRAGKRESSVLRRGAP